MKRIHVGVYLEDENGNILSKRVVSGNWSVDLEYQLKTHFEVDVMDEIASIVNKNLVAQLRPKVMREMIEEAKEKMSDE